MVLAAIASALLIGWVLGVDCAEWRMRRRADSYVTRARTRLVLAEQLEERAQHLLAHIEASRPSLPKALAEARAAGVDYVWFSERLYRTSDGMPMMTQRELERGRPFRRDVS
jgi:hypothetical protein